MPLSIFLFFSQAGNHVHALRARSNSKAATLGEWRLRLKARVANAAQREPGLQLYAQVNGRVAQVMQQVMASALRAMIHWYRAAFRYPPSRPNRVIQAPTVLVWAEDDVVLDKSLTFDSFDASAPASSTWRPPS